MREDEADPASARLALSVRRDSNFRDKVLVVPASAIKVHQRLRGRTVEKTLPERLAELGLGSAARDRNVIVSNQFAIVPVPARRMRGAWPEGVPPRAAFTFSIFPYGSTNFVITDVIEGSHEAIVGPGAAPAAVRQRRRPRRRPSPPAAPRTGGTCSSWSASSRPRAWTWTSSATT